MRETERSCPVSLIAQLMWLLQEMAERVEFESTSDMETKEFWGAA
jgi:hypothetical protein